MKIIIKNDNSIVMGLLSIQNPPNPSAHIDLINEIALSII
tara:strand:- start:1763 stop:1882 length:120 start_codon:yes stop_codon:yes gene_type:complete